MTLHSGDLFETWVPHVGGEDEAVAITHPTCFANLHGVDRLVELFSIHTEELERDIGGYLEQLFELRRRRPSPPA